jgi:hypothetical protein
MATVAQTFEPKGFDLFSSNQPSLVLENGSTIPISGYNFTATSQKMFRRFSAIAYLSGNVTVRIRWYSQTGAITGNVRWDAAIAAITAGDAQSVLTKALATATTTTTTVNGTARGITTTDVTVSNLDSLAADDEVWLAISLGANTMTLGAVIVSVEVIYASTAGVGAGNVSNAGASTDNAVARFDLATGQVIQNSGVIIDDSNNLTGVGTVNTVTIDKWATVAALAAAVNPASTTLANITGLSLSLPRSGTYWIEGMLEVGLATSAQLVAFGMNISANFTRMSVGWVHTLTTSTQIIGQQNASLAVGGTGVASGSHTVFTGATQFSGSITVSGAATVQLLASRAANTLTIGAGSAMNIREL